VGAWAPDKTCSQSIEVLGAEFDTFRFDLWQPISHREISDIGFPYQYAVDVDSRTPSEVPGVCIRYNCVPAMTAYGFLDPINKKKIYLKS
jgi:hypothetical protein